jgi:hypothetical protein
MLGLDNPEAHLVVAIAETVTDLRVLVVGQDAVGAVHVQAEQVLDPVVGVGAAARRGAHLGDPRPHRRTRRVDRDRTRRDAVGVFEQLVARQPR